MANSNKKINKDLRPDSNVPKKKNNTEKRESKLAFFWFNIMPFVFAGIALFFSIFVIYLLRDTFGEDVVVEENPSFVAITEDADYGEDNVYYTFSHSIFKFTYSLERETDEEILQALQEEDTESETATSDDSDSFVTTENTTTSTSSVDTTSGDPNILAILAVLSMFMCLIIIPKMVVKKREKGDGLGAMFMPLGLLGIFIALCAFVDAKDIAWGVVLGITLFVISALGTFKQTIKFTDWICFAMMVILLFCFIMGKMPYCFYHFAPSSFWTRDRYYVSYFIRDEALLAAYAILCSKVRRIYKTNDIK